jgi:hypothetical protein
VYSGCFCPYHAHISSQPCTPPAEYKEDFLSNHHTCLHFPCTACVDCGPHKVHVCYTHSPQLRQDTMSCLLMIYQVPLQRITLTQARVTHRKQVICVTLLCNSEEENEHEQWELRWAHYNVHLPFVKRTSSSLPYQSNRTQTENANRERERGGDWPLVGVG